MSDFFQKRCKLGNNITTKPVNALPFNYDELEKNVSVSALRHLYLHTKIKLSVSFLLN